MKRPHIKTVELIGMTLLSLLLGIVFIEGLDKFTNGLGFIK